MTKHNAPKITMSLWIVTALIFSSQAVFAQTGTATGGHNEIIKRLQDKLAAFKSESLSQEMGTILSETGEVDLGEKLIESYLGSVGKINIALKGVANVSDLSMQNIDKNREALMSVGGLLDEIDQKATLVQTYYDALSDDARKTWSSTARQRMTNGSKPTMDALKALGLVCPANQIELHDTMCFYSYAQIKESLDRIRNLEQNLENAATTLNRSRSPGYDSYDGPQNDYDSSEGMYLDREFGEEGPMQPQRPAKLTWAEQAEALAMGTATPEQVKPLTDLLASVMDGMLAEKRNELALLRRPANSFGFGRNNAYGGGTDGYDEYGPLSSEYGAALPGYPDASSSFRQNAVAPAVTINVAQAYLNRDIRYFVARNLKQMVLDAKDANRDTLLKAWCAVCEVGSSWDVLSLVVADVSPASSAQNPALRQGAPGMPVPPGPPGPPEPPGPPGARGASVSPVESDPRGMSPARGASSPRGSVAAPRNAAMTKLEILSVMSGYRSDLRVHYEAVGCSATDPDLSIQMCFNIGKPIVPMIKMALTSPLSVQAKVALIEATQYIGDPDAAAFLLPLLTSTDRSIVSAAADAIAAVGDRRASAALVKGLENPRLAATIVGILKRMGTTSSQDIIPMFKSANPVTDKFCVDILKDSGDINTLYYLAAILERYHNAPAKKDLPQAEKSELLMLTMDAGAAIISRNMSKTPPKLDIPILVVEGGKPRLDYTAGASANGFSEMNMGMGMGREMGMGRGMDGPDPDGMMLREGPQAMPQRGVPAGSPGSDGTSKDATMPALELLLMPPDEIKNNAPYIWLDMLYKVAAKHIYDTAAIMKDVQTENSGKKIGTDIRNERVDKDFFRTVINTSVEGLGAYMPGDKITGEALKAYPVSKSDVRKLNEQKDRVKRDFGTYEKELNRIKQRNASYNAFIEASTGKKPNASGTSTAGTGGGTTSTTTTNPLGKPL